MPYGNWAYQKRTADITVIATYLRCYVSDYPFDRDGQGRNIANTRYAMDRYPHMLGYWEGFEDYE